MQDFIPTDNGYNYTYRKLVKGVFEFGAVQSKYRWDISMTYEHTDLNKIPRLFKIDSAVYTIIEVSEKEPSISIYKYIDGDQEVFYSSDNPVVGIKLYPSEHGFIFVEYIGDQSKLMEVDGTNVKSMLFIKGEVFDVSSLDGHTYFLILDENQSIVVDENGEETSFVFEDDQTIFFGDSTYIKITDYNPLTLLYETKEDMKNIEIADNDMNGIVFLSIRSIIYPAFS